MLKKNVLDESSKDKTAQLHVEMFHELSMQKRKKERKKNYESMSHGCFHQFPLKATYAHAYICMQFLLTV